MKKCQSCGGITKHWPECEKRNRNRDIKYIVNIPVLLKKMNEQNLTRRGLHKITGIADSGLGYIINGHSKNPSISTICKIADAMNVPVTDLIIKHI